MKNSFPSPVPKEQIPLNEFIEIKQSWFFKLPLSQKRDLYRFILIIWIISIIISYIIATGSIILNTHITHLITVVFLSSCIIPLLLISRLYLGWSYIYKRLQSDIVVYEESDWHDGQKWQKTAEMKKRDALIAEFQVKPIISFVKKCFQFNLILLLISVLIYSFLPRITI